LRRDYYNFLGGNSQIDSTLTNISLSLTYTHTHTLVPSICSAFSLSFSLKYQFLHSLVYASSCLSRRDFNLQSVLIHRCDKQQASDSTCENH
jgi:hypothetical protein